MRKAVFLFVLCLSICLLTACNGEVELPLGHQYGNPEVSYTDQKVIVTYNCIDCDYSVVEERTAVTQVDDSEAWDEAFRNLTMKNYSVSISSAESGKTDTKYCILTEDRGYYGLVASDGETLAREHYTLQKEDGTFITYIRSAEDGATSLAPETDGRYYENIKRESTVYLSCEGMFDKFAYDAQSGSYISTQAVTVALYGADGELIREEVFQNIAVNIVDGNVCQIKGDYRKTNALLEINRVDLCFYNIGFSVVEVPQSMIDEVVNGTAPVDPNPAVHTHSYDDGVVIQEPTCVEPGIKKCTCTICGRDKNVYLPKLTTHNFTDGICVDCGMDDPQNTAGNWGGNIDRLWDSVLNLLKSVIEIITFFK